MTPKRRWHRLKGGKLFEFREGTRVLAVAAQPMGGLTWNWSGMGGRNRRPLGTATEAKADAAEHVRYITKAADRAAARTQQPDNLQG